MIRNNSLALYVHIPFCVSKCRYCDFASFGGMDIGARERYVERLIEEIRTYRREERLLLSTVFFGGGTPSLLEPHLFTRIFSAIKETFLLSENPELTVEANPGTLTCESLAAFTECGVNRISLGLQSIHENELKSLGRIHSFEESREALELARSFGISNINVDLMYGIPHQTADSFSRTLDEVIALSPTHISAYGLIIEEGTPFYSMRDELPLPSEDDEADMYFLAAEKLRGAGYLHYEISNYAKRGFECRHNLVYWRGEEYVGVGLAAHSYFEGCRFSNTENMTEYMMSLDFGKGERVRIDLENEAFEYAMTALRLSEGISLSEYADRFGSSFTEGKPIIDKYIAEGLMRLVGDRLAFTERGFYVQNAILANIL
ncbi:MAG: radical SAM family heme chaperone HemW [Clostridia bacterium]|nr:radical SAM family heme chaperone HemW [Clostridia bacterium]